MQVLGTKSLTIIPACTPPFSITLGSHFGARGELSRGPPSFLEFIHKSYWANGKKQISMVL
jgi:hypothetical protein